MHALCRTGSIAALLDALHSPLAAVLAAQIGRPARSACRHSLARSKYRRKLILQLLSSASLQFRMHAAGSVDSARRSMRTCEPACGAGPAAPALRAQRPRSTRAWIHTDAKERELGICGCMCHAAPRMHGRPDLRSRPSSSVVASHRPPSAPRGAVASSRPFSRASRGRRSGGDTGEGGAVGQIARQWRAGRR